MSTTRVPPARVFIIRRWRRNHPLSRRGDRKRASHDVHPSRPGWFQQFCHHFTAKRIVAKKNVPNSSNKEAFHLKWIRITLRSELDQGFPDTKIIEARFCIVCFAVGFYSNDRGIE